MDLLSCPGHQHCDAHGREELLNSPVIVSEVAAHQGPAPLTSEQGQASSVFARHQQAPVIAESRAAIGTALEGKTMPEAQPAGILSGAKAGYSEGREVHDEPCFGLPVFKHNQSDPSAFTTI